MDLCRLLFIWCCQILRFRLSSLLVNTAMKSNQNQRKNNCANKHLLTSVRAFAKCVKLQEYIAECFITKMMNLTGIVRF